MNTARFSGLLFVFLTAGSAMAASLKISAGASTRQPASEVEGNYTTSHLYVDEIAGDSIPLTVFFDPQAFNIETCEVFTNLNRRDRAGKDANHDGVEDGILPVNGNTILAGDDSHYFKAYPMGLVSNGYQTTLAAVRTGAYRLTVRYRFNGEPAGTWHYYNDDVQNGLNKRDHCIVVSPRKSRDLVIYEVNPLTITAEGTLPSQRGTFAELATGRGAGHAPRFSLDYVKALGANTLWFQPIHPNGIDGRQLDPATGQPYEVGSPYAVRNFFEVMPLMARSFTPGGTPAGNDTPAGRAAAMAEFQQFCAAADAAGVDVMLDAPFNHTSYDTELAAAGQALFGNAGSSAASQIRHVEARFFSRAGAYDMRASSAGNIALAPDRGDFGKFEDTFDVYYGRYAALVSGSTGGHQNEGDWFDHSVGNENAGGGGNGHFDAITRNVWRYFAGYTLHWLDRTGYPANPDGLPLDSTAGIDSLRADFGQGLPPQAWEYIINTTRARKWNFIFMAESLDGGAVTYRSGRHFDILNENIVFPLHAARTTTDFRNIYESRRIAYGQALVLLNTSSHDEDHYQDPWEAAIRHAVNSTIDGVPMIFPGQELGLSGAVVPPGDTQPGIVPYGYDRYETNFGKPIPHFKKYNSLMPLWLKTTPGHPDYSYGLDQLAAVYRAVGRARSVSPALRGSNRYFLNLKDGTPHGQIFSVAKFSQRNAPPNLSDVVFGFVNLDRNAAPATVGGNRFNLAVDADGAGGNDFGIQPGRRYNVRNLAAWSGPAGSGDLLIPGGVTGAELLEQGLYVALNRVPLEDSQWASAPYEPQYLKLLDVTPPPAPGSGTVAGLQFGAVVGDQVTFSWAAAADAEGGVAGYQVRIGTTAGGGEIFTGPVNEAVFAFAPPPGVPLFVTVSQVNAAGVAGAVLEFPAFTLLEPAADADGDGQTNAAEAIAGTDPRSAASVVKILSVARAAGAVQLTVATVPGRFYQVESRPDLAGGAWSPLGDEVEAVDASTRFEHPAGGAARFFRVRVVRR